MSVVFWILAASLISIPLAMQVSPVLVERISARRVFADRLKPKTKYNQLSVMMQIPEFVALLWFAITAGESLDSGLEIAVSRSSGYVSAEFEKVLRAQKHGALLQHELENLAAETRSEQVSELASKLAMSIYNGSALADQLGEYANSVNSELKAKLLEAAGKSETKMMIPLVFIILPVTVLFALYPSLVIIQDSFL